MAKTALQDLYQIMQTGRHMRDRLNAAISASRIERTAVPGEQMPPCIGYLRYVIDHVHEGTKFPDQWRREAATALAFYEKRVGAAVVKANGRGSLIPGSDADGAPGIYRDGDYFYGLADNLNWRREQWNKSPEGQARAALDEEYRLWTAEHPHSTMTEKVEWRAERLRQLEERFPPRRPDLLDVGALREQLRAQRG